MGKSGDGNHCGDLTDPTCQPFPRHSGFGPPSAEGTRGRGKSARSQRYQGPRKREACARNRGGRRPQSLALWPAPGAGKSMLAARLPSILPPLTPTELLEVSMIASVAGEIADGALTNQRPFRAPHHSASMAALVGGGLRVKPGEVSLHIMGSCFWTNSPNSSRESSIHCVSRSRSVKFRSRARTTVLPILPASC